MSLTVQEVLTAANDSVNLINDINANGSDSQYVTLALTQEEINTMVQNNVSHLQTILAYDGSLDFIPDVAGSSEDKSSYTDAIATGNAYIAAN